MKRTDAHRPSAIIPEEYDFVACDYFGGLAALHFQTDRAAFQAHMAATGGKFAEHHNSGSCHICGARAQYVARFHHTPTNTYITTGMDCAEKVAIGDPILFKSFRKRIAAGLKTERGKLKARDLLETRGIVDAWAIYEQGVAPGKQEATIIDIVHKVVRYGSISDGQVDFVHNLLRAIADRPAIEAKRAAEDAAAAPVPATDSRVEFTGKVLTTREEENQYGTAVKMLVQHETGYKLWGTMPRGLDAKRGDVVSFCASVQRSEKDEKFGFFSRPTKAQIVSKIEEVAA